MCRLSRSLDQLLLVALFLFGLCQVPNTLSAQATGTVTGVVVREGTNEPISGVTVQVAGTALSAVTGPDGRFTLHRVPTGQQTLVLRRFGHRPGEQTVTVQADATANVQVGLAFQPVTLAEVIVSGASRTPERVVEAPAAITVVDPVRARDMSVTGQAPMALTTIPGVDVVQSGMNDFNVNARGFNSSLNRRILVLQDGRDLAVPFLGSQEWAGFSMALDEVDRIEMVRGPGSALYGANAFSGVLNVITPAARDIRGTKLTVAGGEIETFRVDGRHAGVFGEGRFGYRLSGGYSRSDTFSRSRTLIDGSSLQQEYADATDSLPPLAVEVVPLKGQTKDLATGAPLGERDELETIYGSGRFDFYAPNGAVFTVDGGFTQAKNEIAVTGIGRVQVEETLRPWARASWAAPRYNVMAYYSGRITTEPQRSLAANLALEETSSLLHIEAQYNRAFAGDRGRVVIGASARDHLVDTENTLMAPENDDRSDQFFAGYAQVEFKIVPRVRLVAAARVDEGDLYDTQFSPRGAIVFSPNDDHSFRFTVNRAFQVPNYSEFFLRVPAGAPADLALLEAGLRASPLGPVLAGVPTGELFTNSAAVPVLALGYADLDVEHITALEGGWKGQFKNRVFVSVDGYWNRLTDFVTDLLPGVNPDFGAWTAPDAVPAAFRPALEDAVRNSLLGAGQQLAALGLTRLADGSSAIVVSYTNAGKVDEWGVELALDVNLTNEFTASAGYRYFDFDIKEFRSVTPGVEDILLPNTPENQFTGTLAYRGRQGFEASISARLVDNYSWSAGVFAGHIPARETFDATASYAVNNNLRLHATATNVFDQEKFQIFGGSVIGRRVIGGVTAMF